MTLQQPWDMPDTYEQFPTHEQVLEYLNHYADKHGIRQHCRFGCRVEQATFDEAKRCWCVIYKEVASGVERTECFSDLIAASGLSGRQGANIPAELAKQCESAGIPYCHSSAIKQPASYANKRMLVVGLGFSGADMASQLAEHASAVVASVRSRQYVMSMDDRRGAVGPGFLASSGPDISGLPRLDGDSAAVGERGSNARSAGGDQQASGRKSAWCRPNTGCSPSCHRWMMASS